MEKQGMGVDSHSELSAQQKEGFFSERKSVCRHLFATLLLATTTLGTPAFAEHADTATTLKESRAKEVIEMREQVVRAICEHFGIPVFFSGGRLMTVMLTQKLYYLPSYRLEYDDGRYTLALTVAVEGGKQQTITLSLSDERVKSKMKI